MMNFVEKKGSNNHLIIMLHGTGGTADSLFSIGEYLDAEANLIGIEGEVLENGMRRYFERYPDGTFKLRSLSEATQKLYKTINDILKESTYDKVSLVGYSNGANIALNLMKEYSNIPIDKAILYHPSTVRPDTNYLKQNKVDVLITSGKNDPFISELEFDTLYNDLLKENINVKQMSHDYGHQLIQEELDFSKEFIES